jgi:hypothetical protein
LNLEADCVVITTQETELTAYTKQEPDNIKVEPRNIRMVEKNSKREQQTTGKMKLLSEKL